MFVLAFILMLPVIFKGLRRFTRLVHKSLIRHDPFGELEEQRRKMLQNRKIFKDSKAKIKALKNNMEAESLKAEKEAKDFQSHLVSLQNQAQKLRSEMERIVSEKGNKGKDTDEYVELHSALARKLSESQRVTHQLEQSNWVNDWVSPGMRLPVFDVEPLVEFADAPGRLLFTAELLVGFAAPSTMPVPAGQLDLDGIVEWLNAVDPADRARLLRRLGDIALFVALSMAIFAILFGTRHIDATEHQDGDRPRHGSSHLSQRRRRRRPSHPHRCDAPAR